MKDPMKDVVTLEKGATYQLPVYGIDENGVVDKEPFELKFCKGAKDDPNVPRQDGLFTESLLMASRQYLSDVNVGDLRNNLTTQAIQRIDEAISLIRRRARDRQQAGVQNTMKPIGATLPKSAPEPVTEAPIAVAAPQPEWNDQQPPAPTQPEPEVEVPTAPESSTDHSVIDGSEL